VNVKIVRVPAPSGFTQVPNASLRDERLSYKARGIHANLLSNSDNGWVETAETLAAKSPDGRHAVRTGLQELSRYGYIAYRKTQGPDGKWSTVMIVYTSPESENLLPAPPAQTPLNPQVTPKSENLTSDRGQKTRSRSEQGKRESSQVAPEAGFPTSENLTLTRRPSPKTKTEDHGGTAPRRQPAAAPPAEPRRPDGLTEIPGDFRPTDSMRRWAVGTYGAAIDVEYETAQFISHYRSTGARRKSWPDAWQKWVRESAERRRSRPGATVVPIDRRQQATNDLFERAMQRAIAREEQQ
jgi:hypothetical protein